MRRGLLLGVIVGSFVFAACSGGGGAAEPPAPEPDLRVEVHVAAARRGPIGQHLSAPGTLEARRTSRIGTEVQGRIEHVFVEEGDAVEAGAPLFQIDPQTYEVALRQAVALLDLAAAERQQGESDLARARTLAKRDAVARQELERIETGLAVARARERQAREQVALARDRLERTLVRAPYAGSIAARLEDEGTTALVQPQTIVVVLQESGFLEAHAAIPEGQLAHVRPGDAVRVWVEGHPGPIDATVSSVSDAIDPATRTYSVRAAVPNADHTLKAGVFARVEIAPRDKADALLVPRDAIRSEEGRTRVFTVREGRAEPVPVTLGLVTEDQAEVLEGLEPGVPVITGETARQIAAGMPVRVVSAGDGAP